jgi:hypothetical protein
MVPVNASIDQFRIDPAVRPYIFKLFYIVLFAGTTPSSMLLRSRDLEERQLPLVKGMV